MSIIHKGADTAKYSVALPIRLSDSLEADAVKTVAARGVVMNLPFEVDCDLLALPRAHLQLHPLF